MNTLLWILQTLMALHTGAGAIWKVFTTAEQTMPSLGAIPQPAWMALGAVELACAVLLVLPAYQKNAMRFVPFAAVFIAAEMLIFCALHFMSGDSNFGPVVYWLVVAAICAFIGHFRYHSKAIAARH